MVKIYQAESIIAISVRMPNGTSRHISFDETHDGFSSFVTADPALQKAIENSPAFNTWFTLLETRDEQKKEEETKAPESETKVVKVSSVAEARDYLAETYELSRTTLRTKAAILAAANELGITFDGLK